MTPDTVTTGTVTTGTTAPRTRRIWVLATMFGVAVVVLAADAISKAQVLAKLPAHPPVRLLDGLITLDLTFNPGAAFGVGTSYTAVIALIVCGVIVAIIRTARRLRSWAWTIALGLLLGGAMGNLGDRLFRPPGLLRGRVVDWINLPHFPWTFNLADASITCAAVIIAILALRGIRIDGTTPAHAAERITAAPQPSPILPTSTSSATPTSSATSATPPFPNTQGVGGTSGTQERAQWHTDSLPAPPANASLSQAPLRSPSPSTQTRSASRWPWQVTFLVTVGHFTPNSGDFGPRSSASFVR